MKQPTRRVFLVWRPWLGPFAVAFAKRLKRDGAEVHLYVARPEGIAAVEKAAGMDVFARIVPFQVIYQRACKPIESEKDEISRALALETWLGAKFAKLAVGDRHLGRGYALGAPNFPTSAQSRSSHGEALAAYSEQVEFWRCELETYNPDLVLDGDLILGACAGRLRIPTRVLAASRHRNFYYWADNAYLETARLRPAWEELTRRKVKAPARTVAPATTIDTYWQTAMETTTRLHLAKVVGAQIVVRAKKAVRGIPTAPGYDTASNIAYLFRFRRDTIRMIGPSTVRLGDLNGRRVVYFPLATEPEMTLQGLSPEYFFQLEAIAATARSLPADTVLAVKEHHPACGARADHFYDQILAFKNVRMLDLRERGVDAIRRADLTVTIAGSAGFEAAAMGKPTIVLGRHNIYDFLPHVRVVKDIALLDDAVQSALDQEFTGPTTADDASRFLAAIEAISFDMDAFDPFSKTSRVGDSTTEGAYQCLFASLGTLTHAPADA